MVAEEVFVNCYNFNPIRAQHASIHVKKYWDSGQKRYLIFKVSYKIIRSRVWSLSLNSDLRLRGAGAERNIFGFTTLLSPSAFSVSIFPPLSFVPFSGLFSPIYLYSYFSLLSMACHSLFLCFLQF